MSEEWSYERKFEQFKKEVHERFVREEAFWQLIEKLDIQSLIRERGIEAYNRLPPNFHEYRPSMEWDCYQNTKFFLDGGIVKIILGGTYALRPEWIHFFEHTSVAWDKLSLSAEVIDGQPRVVLDFCLIDYWNDEREAEWHATTKKWEPDHKYDWKQWYPDGNVEELYESSSNP